MKVRTAIRPLRTIPRLTKREAAWMVAVALIECTTYFALGYLARPTIDAWIARLT